jgi:hypothetical protein
MMPVIRIPDSLYERLQKHAVPFVDTPATVIERLVSAYETSQSPTNSDTRNRDPAPARTDVPAGGEPDVYDGGQQHTGRGRKDNPWAGGGKPLPDGSTAVSIPEHLRDKVTVVREALKDAHPEVGVTTSGKCKVKCWGDSLTGFIRALAVEGFDRDQVRLIVTVLVEGNENAVVHEGTINTQYGVGRRIKAGNPPAEGIHGGGSYCDIPAPTLKALKAAFR